MDKTTSRRLRVALGWLVSLAVMAFIVQAVEWGEVARQLARVRLVYLVPLTLITAVHFLIRAWRWRYLLPGGRATLPLLVGPGAARAPIRGAEGWKRIVENLVVVVAELERTFVADVIEAAGPAPEWFEAPGFGGL